MKQKLITLQIFFIYSHTVICLVFETSYISHDKCFQFFPKNVNFEVPFHVLFLNDLIARHEAQFVGLLLLSEKENYNLFCIMNFKYS